MKNGFFSKLLKFSFLAITLTPLAWADGETAPARDPKQPVDEAYTAKMKKYTTAPYFTSPLVDYLPASKNVPRSSRRQLPTLWQCPHGPQAAQGSVGP